MIERREFLKRSALAATASSLSVPLETSANPGIDSIVFEGADSLTLGSGWETLNPGYWQIKDGALRRRLKNVGDRARRTGFPFHAVNAGKVMETEYDPSLPTGILYRRDYRLRDEFTVAARFTFRGARPEPVEGDDPEWKMYQDGYGVMGLAIGAKSLFESYGKDRNTIQVGWSDDGQFGWLKVPGKKGKLERAPLEKPVRPGDECWIRVEVSPAGGERSQVRAVLSAAGEEQSVTMEVPRRITEGFAGIVARGLIDFEVNEYKVEKAANEALEVGEVECYACYPLGDSLRVEGGSWKVRFVALFDHDGKQAELRISDSADPEGGWETVPVCGVAAIVNHEWRRNTAVIEASLPVNPALKTLYYTVWKDGLDVTGDPRIGTAGVGPGTGMVGDVPATGSYVGRLPQLIAPYKLCGLSCHAITSGLQQKTEEGWKILGGGADWQFRDQPSVGSYQHLEDFNFQIMVWEDDVWYMELVLYPPSTDDAYQVVKSSICGPTSRWQLMRHWNVINPGDHDYGMDDVKGPEQIVIRSVEGLGQDPEYMKRNFQIVHHLITGEEEVDPLANPKKWRAWKMPNRDFTFVILDSRLWRSSQDVDIWDDAGWDKFKSLYSRTDPTRSLLGEEQFAWLDELIATDSSPLICLTGLNGLHTVWTGQNWGGDRPAVFDERDRVAADYAGWVKAGADRVLELLGSRDGVVTVYGDVHNGSIMKNLEHGVVECSFGPIGRSGGRAVIPGFGHRMKDFDGRDLEMVALYHKSYANAGLEPHEEGEPFYWNFLEMEFDPRQTDGRIGLRIRNLIDSPDEPPRGGNSLETVSSKTGRTPSSLLPEIKTLPGADVRFVHANGKPIRGCRTGPGGEVPVKGLVDVAPGSKVIVTAFDGEESHSQVVTTRPLG